MQAITESVAHSAFESSISQRWAGLLYPHYMYPHYMSPFHTNVVYIPYQYSTFHNIIVHIPCQHCPRSIPILSPFHTNTVPIPLQLKSLRTSDNKSSLLHFLANTVERKYPQVLDFPGDLGFISKAARGEKHRPSLCTNNSQTQSQSSLPLTN